MLDERVRRVEMLPESDETDRPVLDRMLSIMFAYRERRFLRDLGCVCERKNELHGLGDVFLGKLEVCTISPFALGVCPRLTETTLSCGLTGHVL